jgi:ABC-type uncharacterized transport system substrate-binding protein
VAALAAVASSVEAQVLVVLSAQATAYREVADAFREGLRPIRGAGATVTVVDAQELTTRGDAAFSGHDLVVTIGLSAADAVLSRRGSATVPRILCLLLPRKSFEALVALGPPPDGRLAALYIDQPVSRQLDLVRLALPDRTRVGVIFGPDSAGLRDELKDQARDRGLTLWPADVSDSSRVHAASQSVLPHVDLLLALPDPIAFNSASAYALMLASYRAGVPVVGFSEALVKAGALVAVFSTPQQQGRQGAEIANRLLAGDPLVERYQYPRYFTVRVNASVARSLDIHVPDDATLEARLGDRPGVRGPGPQREGSPPRGKSP